MKWIILLVLVLTMTACASSFNDCMGTCKSIHMDEEDFQETYWSNWANQNITIPDWDKLKEYCFNECTDS